MAMLLFGRLKKRLENIFGHPSLFIIEFVESKMRYTQLNQVKRLLHELMEDRQHGFPCDCGACIYAAYRRGKKDEGRSFSKRTFFVFFLRMDHFMATFCDRQLWDRGSLIPLKERPGIFYWQSSLAKIAKERRAEIQDRKNLEREPPILSTDIYIEKVKFNTRKRTLAMIKKLEEREKSRRGKAFLRGILNKKCFYTYYGRAGDRELFKIVNECRTRILSPLPGGPASAARSNRSGSGRSGT